MNYIKRLEQSDLAATQRFLATEKALIDFRVYLASSKFWDDTTIQVSDVHGWLDRIKAANNLEPEDIDQ